MLFAAETSEMSTIVVALIASLGVLGTGWFGFLGIKAQIKAAGAATEERINQLNTTNTDQHNQNASLIETMIDLITEHSIIVREIVNIQDRAIFRGDPEGELISANPAAIKLYGMSPTDMMHNGWICAIRPKDKERVFEAWLTALQGKTIMGPISFAIINQTTMEEIYVECVSTPVISRVDHNIVSWISVVVPVLVDTDTKPKEEAHAGVE